MNILRIPKEIYDIINDKAKKEVDAAMVKLTAVRANTYSNYFQPWTTGVSVVVITPLIDILEEQYKGTELYTSEKELVRIRKELQETTKVIQAISTIKTHLKDV